MNIPKPSSLPPASRRRGIAFVTAAILLQMFWMGFPSAALSVMLLIAYQLWISTDWRAGTGAQKAFVAGILVFFLHLAEEYSTGLQAALPGLFGTGPWTDLQFLGFNALWAITFVTSAAYLARERPLTGLIALFFAIAGGVGNGVLHLLLTLRQGAYFPGAWTAPLCFLVGVWMLRELYRPSPYE